MSDLYITTWGDGAPVVLVHGAFATGVEEWAAQQPLAKEAFRLLVPDRRGYGRSPAAEGEDFLRDAEDIAEVLGDGAHVVAQTGSSPKSPGRCEAGAAPTNSSSPTPARLSAVDLGRIS